MTITVLGADGFIGSHMVKHLQATSIDHRPIGRDDPWDGHLGDVIDCVGVTADFRSRPYDTINSHVTRVAEFLQTANFRSFLYLSSTRVYRWATEGLEDVPIPVKSADPSDLYAISKLAGEALCLRIDDANVRVARLSNVFGIDVWAPTFLASLIRDAVLEGRVKLGVGESSTRDFVAISDVVHLLQSIATSGGHRIYNVASGHNVLVGNLLRHVCSLTGATFIQGDAPPVLFPNISIDRLHDEFGFSPVTLASQLPLMVDSFRRSLTS